MSDRLRRAAELWLEGDTDSRDTLAEEFGYEDVDELCDSLATAYVESHPADDEEPLQEDEVEAAMRSSPAWSHDIIWDTWILADRPGMTRKKDLRHLLDLLGIPPAATTTPPSHEGEDDGPTE